MATDPKKTDAPPSDPIRNPDTQPNWQPQHNPSQYPASRPDEVPATQEPLGVPNRKNI